jgi:hypothetical protein
MHTKIRFVLLLIIPVLTASEIYSVEIAKDKLKISDKSEEYIPYISNYPLNKTNEKIQNVILSIHSSNYDAYLVYNNTMELINKYNLADSVLVISPQFLIEKYVGSINSPNLVYWRALPFWGSSGAKVTPDGAEFRMSAYTILENIIVSLCEKKTFPNLRSIVILGHSGGGQLVNRFAASNTVEDTSAKSAGIKIKYIVMNPSSYVYFSPQRPVKGSRKLFATPDANTGYDDYGYGLANLYAYHRHKGLSAEKMRQQYQKRNVIYMLGTKDTTPKGMSITPAAMLQGENRLKRGLSYYGYLIDEFGPQIKEYQKLVIVPNVGHSGKNMMLSPRGAINIIDDFVAKPNISTIRPVSDFVSESQLPEEDEKSNGNSADN